ncbi:MAG: LpxI family protein [Phycisphaerales bacterium]
MSASPHHPGLPASAPPIGVIAGGGTLPSLVAEGIRAAGRSVVGIGLRGNFEADFPGRCDHFGTAGTVRLGHWIRLARRFGVEEAIMVGRVSKLRLHNPVGVLLELPDVRTCRFWYRRMRGPDRRSSVLLAAVADELLEGGVRLIDSTRFIPDHLATEGLLGRVQPSAKQFADVAMGWPILRQVAQMDVGQSIAVRAGDVVAVEAAEGTDQLIERAGSLCRKGGWTLLKTARDAHDMRSDVPTIGVATIENLARSRAACLAVGAGRTILLDKPAVIAAADRLGIALLGVPSEGASVESLTALCERR